MKAPFPYFGGKSRVAHLIWPRFGNPKNYIEPFAGSLAVLLARPDWQGAVETVNDLDCYLSNFWRATQCAPDEVARFADWPVNEADLHARHNWLVNSECSQEFRQRMKTDPDYFDAKVAGWWVWGISQWIGSGWCVNPHWTGRTNAGAAARGIQAISASSSARVSQQIPHLSDAGRGVHRAQTLPQKLPILGNYGVGVHAQTRQVSQQIPYLKSDGMGIHRNSHAVTGGLYEYFDALRARLRRVRVCCGDWTRVLGPAVTTCIGEAAVFLDPPYSLKECDDVYSVKSDVSSSVRAWAIENGDNPQLKIALCGYEGEHEMPDCWECVAWKANGGYGAKGNGRGKANAHRERIWFSPYCLKPSQGLFAHVEALS